MTQVYYTPTRRPKHQGKHGAVWCSSCYMRKERRILRVPCVARARNARGEKISRKKPLRPAKKTGTAQARKHKKIV